MVGGIRSMRLIAAAAALSMAAGPMPEPLRSIPDDPERARWRDQERRRRESRLHEERAWERRQRKQRNDEEREQRLRQRIATGKDDRPDKYLHAAARRRREAERAASLAPATETSGA